jgi:chromosome segregation protein
LLKLKKLQILGFKSFCDRTELKFQGDGVAAIVGPNGCGKSNIADAISWVLGEQSAKSLRGSRMEDVIFIGTRDRKPTGMAEVSLTLIDPEVYEGNANFTEPEIDVQNDLSEDWDEATVRATAAEETEQHLAEVQPLGPEEVLVDGAAPIEGQAPEGSLGAADQEPAPVQAEEGATPGEADLPQADSGNASAAEHAPQHVVLKIRRRKFKTTQFKAGELVVTRRLFRSGESEYLLNGKLCRLRDIQDIFMGTGLGPESYAIIEQGRIGQILSSKPYDRRAIIEEAAGITKFKTKKRLAEARLEQSKLNLSRINDIFDEVTRQMNSLKRQASKAERYARLRDEMRLKLRLVLASKFTQLEREAKQLESELAAISAEMQAKNEAVQALEVEHSERTQRGYAIEDEAKRNSEHLSTLAMEIDRGISRQRTNEERCAELEARSAAALAELERTREQLDGLQKELSSNRAVLESAAAEVASAQSEASQRQREAATASESLASSEREQEAKRTAIMEEVAAASAIHNRVAKAEEHSAALDRELQRLQQEARDASSQIVAFGGQRGQIAFEFESVSQRVTALAGQIADAQRQIADKKTAESEAKVRLDALRAEYASTLGKRGALEAIIAEHGYSTESVQRLFQSGAVEKGFAPVGVLADFLEVDDQYEHVVEDFLRDELNYIVVQSWDAADQGLQILRNDVDGRATFLVHSEDAQEKFAFLIDDNARPRRRDAEGRPADAIVPLKKCIRVLNGFGRSLEGILPKLGHGYIAPDSTTAREMALENPNAFFLAPNGETFHNLTVTGGKQRAEGPLSMKRQLRDLQRHLAEMEQSLRTDEAYTATLAREITELTKLLTHLEEDRRESEKLALTSGHALQQLEIELEKTQQRLGTYEAEISRVSAEREQAQSTVGEMRQESELHETRRKELESEVAAIQSRLAAMKESRDLAAQTASQMSARVAALEERRIAASSALQRIETLVAEVNSRVASLEAQIDSAAAEKQQRLAENARLTEQLASYAAERQAAEHRGIELQKESEQVRARVVEIEHELREVRQLLDAARDRRGELSAALAKLSSDVEYMAETCRNELSVGRDELLADPAVGRVEGEALTVEDTAYREMRTKLDNMGPVNMMALEEYKETAERHAFLETQRKDLLDSIENTLSSIKEIDAISRQKFEEAFERINENFQFTFRKLFGGGQAFMRLTDLENTSESGIDVIASPPGKKLQNVLLLSGGEKALTALSLLVGIFQFQPSPFCILDEVDAPLDEANVGRFTELVKEMSVQTQFVIITHNKKTMSISPTLYGVTMQEPGVSKIVSVRFGEEEAKAAS